MNDLELANEKKLEIVQKVLEDFEGAKLEFANSKAPKKEDLTPEETSP